MNVEHHVRIGKIRTAGPGEVLKTVLGSCVGIALLWRRRGKYALAHCLLPQTANGGRDAEARYVDQAVPNLIARLGASPADLDEIEALVAGGGRMIEAEHGLKIAVGEENLKAARAQLEKHRIRIVSFEPGIDRGTRIRIDGSTGSYEISRMNGFGEED